MKLLNKIKRILLLKKELFTIPFNNNGLSSLEDKAKNKPLFDLIKSKHNDYIRQISSPEMAMSLDLAFFIMDYCIEHKPTHLIDLGSGFSSFVFRIYQANFKEINIIVYSIDDNDDWLEKTKKYMNEQHLNDEHLYNLEVLKTLNLKNYFDLILLDLNFVEIRKDYIDFSAQLLNNNGILIIDDVHKIEFLREVKAIAKINKYSLLNIKKQTLDSFGRFAILLKK